ncbi:hypothetical protein BSM4216_3866 (plasmid) [Bacillus smithii]|nr:hypothetical protein BSM4216_3866 [Bacillus smithii]
MDLVKVFYPVFCGRQQGRLFGVVAEQPFYFVVFYFLFTLINILTPKTPKF